MGKPMAQNLIKAGYDLIVYDVVPEKLAAAVQAGAQVGASSKDVAAKSEMVITMLPNSPDVKEAVLGAGGVLEGAKRGTILIDMSSIAPLASREIAAKAKEKGVRCEKPVWKPLNKDKPSLKCPNSDYANAHALSIPLYPSLKEDEVEHVTGTLKAAFKKH